MHGLLPYETKLKYTGSFPECPSIWDGSAHLPATPVTNVDGVFDLSKKLSQRILPKLKLGVAGDLSKTLIQETILNFPLGL